MERRVEGQGWNFEEQERAKDEEFKSRECNFSLLGKLGEISVLSTRDMENFQEGMGTNITCNRRS